MALLNKHSLVALTLFAVTASAHALNGNDALRMHNGGEESKLLLFAYVRGFVESNAMMNSVLRSKAEDGSSGKQFLDSLAPKMICLPQGVDVQQTYDVLIQWLQEHPENRQEDLVVHATVAFRLAWRCKP